MLNLPRAFSLSLFALALNAGICAVPIEANFIDGPSAFEQWSDVQKSTFTAAMTYLGSIFVPTYEGQKWTINATLQDLGDGTLASANPTGYDDIISGGVSLYYASSLYNTIQASEEITGPVAEISFNYRVLEWNYSTTPDGVEPGDNSFYTTAIHEMTHGLGFISFLEADGTWASDVQSVYDSYLALIEGDTVTSLLDLSTEELEDAYTSDSLYWIGEHGMAGNGGDPIQIFAPDPADIGSSISHIDPDVSPIDLIMYPFAPPGQIESFTFSDMELGMLRDMGYDVVPEPAVVWLLLFAGAGLLVWQGRRQKGRAS